RYETTHYRHGTRPNVPPTPAQEDEMHAMRHLFYGLHLVSADDLGMKPASAADEPVDAERCYKQAIDWLPKALQDEDLASHTRVSVPIVSDPMRKKTRLWLTLGVRLAKLDASYARPPHLKPAQGGEWQPVEAHRL